MTVELTPDPEGTQLAPPTTGPTVPEGSIEIRIDDLTVLPLEPGDVIVLKLRQHISQRDGARARELIMSKLPGHEVLVIAGDGELAVLRPPHIRVIEESATNLDRFDDDRAVLDA